MALESSLWQRVRKAGMALKQIGHDVHMGRIENAAGVGNPDVDMCIDAVQVWLELKSEYRPARRTTSIRPKVRVDQEIWLRERCEAGCKNAFVLLQVGEAALARLYLIPGNRYGEITTTEDNLAKMSVVQPTEPMTYVLMQAKRGW
jgi:hypothetical protein